MASADVKKQLQRLRTISLFVTPILFTAVLLGVLLLMFNTDWRNSALEFGHKIPIVKSMLPAPDKTEQSSGKTDAELTVSNAKSKVDELNALLSDRETALKQATDETAQQKKLIDELKAKVDELTKDNSEKTISSDAYRSRITSLADMYGKMTPSKAAPILESMTSDESALVLGAMSDTLRGRVLERMTPKKAAEVSMKLKDADTVDSREIAALQSRIKELELQAGTKTSELDNAELNRTFSAMKPANAATLLLQMASTNQDKALRIISLLDDSARSNVLASMSDLDKKKTAALVSKLMPTSNP